ncbi:serine/threonine-protein kinase [Streptomyces nitrosporeus]|uniref:serine/threonine-protein kinase n=1 Tax=Streptomyces nitrosporeus TaxID=28894 RepID=UPI00331BC979
MGRTADFRSGVPYRRAVDTLSPDDPSTIGPYRLIGRLGAGGMGRVYAARSEGGRTVAVKVVHDGFAHSPEFRRRFAQEVESARKVGGAWTAPVLDADTDGPAPWVATGYIPGPDLYTVVSRERGPLPVASVLALACGLAGALGDIHGAGLVHRDLKPSNILLTADGPRVIDFGIARALETPVGGFLTRTGVVIGSPGFMSPEQVRGERRLTPSSDVFCLGTVLHYAATGRTPFGDLDSGPHALMFRIAEEEADLTGLPSPLAELVRDCLHKDPSLRPTPQEIAVRTGPWSPGTRPGWLPAELLARLGSRAGLLLNQDAPGRPTAAPRTEAGPAPEGGPGAGPKAEPGKEPEPGPEDGTAAGEAVRPRRGSRRLRRGAALAAALLVLTGLGVVLAPLLGEGSTAKDGEGKPGRSTASATPSAPGEAAFVGTWTGEVTEGTEEDGITYVSFTIDGRPKAWPRAEFFLQSSDQVCQGKVPAMVVEDNRTVVRHTDMESTEFDQGPACSPKTQTLTLKGDALEWRAGGSKALLRQDPLAQPSKEVLRTYAGSWTTSDTTPPMRLDIRDLGPGAEIEFSAGEDESRCDVTAVVTQISADQLLAGERTPNTPELGICHGHVTFDISPVGTDRLEILTRRGTNYVFTRTGA